MVKIIVGMMGSSVARGSKSLSTPSQVQEFLDCIKSHTKANVRELDTALVYNGGESEKLLGQVFSSSSSSSSSNNKSHFQISTKAPGFTPHSLTPSAILTNCTTSLTSLQLPSVDIYYIHGPDRSTPLESQCSAFAQLHRAQKFTRFGLSNLSDAEVQQIHDICSAHQSSSTDDGYPLPTVYQGGYSPLHRKSEKTLLPLLRKLGISYYAFSPLAGGLLAKPVEEILNPVKDSRFDAMPVFGDLFLNATILAALRKQTEICRRNGMSIMEGTLRWFMHHSPLQENDGIVLGASTTEQIDKSLSACEQGPLPEEVVRGFEDMWVEVEEVAPGYHG